MLALTPNPSADSEPNPRGLVMTARRRWKEGRDKRERGRFLALPYAVLTSAAYLSLSPHGIKLLIDLGVHYNGSNNGDL